MTTFADTQLVTPGRTIDLSDWENRPRYFSMPEGQYGITSTGVIYRFKRYDQTTLDDTDITSYGEWIRNEVYEGTIQNDISTVEFSRVFTGAESSLPTGWSFTESSGGSITYNPSESPAYIEFNNPSAGATSRLLLTNGTIPNDTQGAIYWCGYVYYESQSSSNPTNLTFFHPGANEFFTDFFDNSTDFRYKFSIDAAESGQDFGPTISIGEWIWFETYFPDLTTTSTMNRFAWINWHESISASDVDNSPQGGNRIFAVGNANFSDGVAVVRVRDFSLIKFNS